MAYLFHLLVHTPSGVCSGLFEDILRAISKNVPCRMLFFGSAPTMEPSQLCEIVSFGLPQNDFSQVPYYLMRNLTPDIPLFFLWADDPTTGEGIISEILSYANRLLFQIPSPSPLFSFSQRMQSGSIRIPENALDIDWTFTNGWRQVLYNVFDDKDDLMQLKSSKQIEIDFNSHHTGPDVLQDSVPAIYLACWLIGQLNWKLERQEIGSQNIRIIYCSGPQGSIQILLRPQNDKAMPCGTISVVEILSYEDVLYSITHLPLLARVIVHVTSPKECLLPSTLSLPDIRNGFSALRDLFFSSPSPHYRTLIKTIGQVKW